MASIKQVKIIELIQDKYMPRKDVSAKVSSMELYSPKLAGLNQKILNEKANWKKISRIDHFSKENKPDSKLFSLHKAVQFN